MMKKYLAYITCAAAIAPTSEKGACTVADEIAKELAEGEVSVLIFETKVTRVVEDTE